MTRDLDESFDLSFGPQRREPGELESWQKTLDDISGVFANVEPARPE